MIRPPAFSLGLTLVLGISHVAHAEPMTPGTVFRDCTACPEIVVVPAGSAQIGSSEAEGAREGVPEHVQAQEKPAHTVVIPKPFGVGRTEVTKADYAAFVMATGRRDSDGCIVWHDDNGKWLHTEGMSWRDPGFAQTENDPVVCITWFDAMAYLDWLSERAGKRYRLLTEAEWEYAARAGTQTTRPWGDGRENACAHANVSDLTRVAPHPILTGEPDKVFGCRDGYDFTAPVGTFPPNDFGLQDMVGNVWEWLSDCANESYQGAPADGSPWTSGDCSRRAYRGGSWYDPPRNLRVARRVWVKAEDGVSLRGMRVARDLNELPEQPLPAGDHTP